MQNNCMTMKIAMHGEIASEILQKQSWIDENKVFIMQSKRLTF